MISPPGNILDSRINRTELKNLFGQAVGTIFKGEVTVQYKSEFTEHQGRIAMQMENTTKMEKISVMVTNPEGNNGIDFNISPVNYQTQHPVVMMQVICIAPVIYLPQCIIFYENALGEKKKIEFSLPILHNKFIIPVEMPENIFNKFYTEYSNPNDNNFFKIDSFIDNPAPPQVPIAEVLKKAGGLLTNVLNLKVIPIPDLNNL